MRLQHLDLLGYKTFADRAEFLFDGGITAIVGPNGSGKSNIADAVRWVLGEQSFSLLRAKKSEDMIFSGSERRARMGMAEATITLDNSSNWLPVEFSEVAITRRSYRSGENVYLLNGSRVRLRDLNDLLGKSGLSKRTYTVIGQGLIDAALSLRPEERRRLIEEAAGLTRYQARRADALGKLDETRQNVLRVHDLISEIEPRLRRLSRQAERAQEHEQVRRELDGALRVWYSFQWMQGQDELGRVRAIEAYESKQVEGQRAHVRELSEQIARVRSDQGRLRDQVGRWHRESSALHAQSEAHQRDLAVAEERRRGLMQRRDELRSDIVPLETSRTAQLERIGEVEQALVSLQEVLDAQQAQAEEAAAALDAWQRETAALQSARREAQEQVLSLRTQAADYQSRLTQLGERRDELQQAKAAYESSCQVLENKARALQGQLSDLDEVLQVIADSVSGVEQQREQREQRIATAQARQRGLQEQRSKLDQRLGRLRERYAVLTRMHEEGAGLYEGVRNVLQASPGRLNGIVGTVAGLIDVPRELETAIEVALGGQLQDVIAETWSDAQQAIAYLKSSQGGRATFLPLDTLRVGQSVRAPQMAGVVGVASDLVQCEPRLRPVAQYLLGRTIVCKDLPVARRVLGQVSGSYQIVTSEGEQVRSSGAVTGGVRKSGRQGGMLARERERRELPEQLGALSAQRKSLDDAMAEAISQEKALCDENAVLGVQRAKLAAERSERQREHGSIAQQIDRAQNEGQWHRSLAADSDRELAGLDQREQGLCDGLEDLQTQVDTCQSTLARLEQEIGQKDDQDLNVRLAERRAAMALTRQEQASRQAELEGDRHSLRQVNRQIAGRHRRIDEMAEQLLHIDARIADLREQGGALAVDLCAYAEQIEPAEQGLQALKDRQERVEKQEADARTRLQAGESRHGQTQLRVARREDQLKHLRSQIEDDLGLVDLDMGEALSGQPLLPIKPLVSSLPEVPVLPEGTEEQIQALRRRLHRLGAINPDAPKDYQETRERYDFLVAQSQDLEEAAGHLSQVIAELDEVMQREFRQTFEAVAREFKAYFSRLFNGGSARLELTTPDDLVTTGIDIVARPPGKRQQGLAVLSGGERALTAAALVFAILTISPTPFCVLDEVDAALDEANVGRFRTVLKELAQQTQFVIITHNRYTIEAADIVYGVSMGSDGASCVISHRMQETD